MAYVIRAEDGQYVTPASSDRAYAHGLAKARIFPSRADAEREATPGEVVMNVDALLPMLAPIRMSTGWQYRVVDTTFPPAGDECTAGATIRVCS